MTSPHNPWLAHSVRIERISAETPGVATYDLALQDPAIAEHYQFAPGQFNMLYLPGLGEIAISISGNPEHRGPIPHTIRVAGNVTGTLASIPVGSTIAIRGPFGSCWPVDRIHHRDVVIVAGGIGLAPLRPAIYHLMQHREKYGRVSLLIGARDPSGLLYRSEYETWRAQGIDVQVTVDRADDSWLGHVGIVTPMMDRLPLKDPGDTVLMTCGPEIMMWFIVQSALNRGLKSDSLYVSLERNMNCAIGLCGHCQFGPQFLCKDGPVFSFDRVASILKVDDL